MYKVIRFNRQSAAATTIRLFGLFGYNAKLFLMLMRNYEARAPAIMCENASLFSIFIYINNFGLRRRFPQQSGVWSLGKGFSSHRNVNRNEF